MKCGGCGESLRRGQIVCPRCGTAQSRKPNTVRCAVCGERVAAHLWVCPQCGHDLLAVHPRLWQRPVVRAMTLAVLGTTVLLIILISGVPHAGAERPSSIFWLATARPTDTPTVTPSPTATHTPTATPSPTPSPTATPTPLVHMPPATGVVLVSPLPHVFQRLNNCGPASISMVLAHFGITQSQEDVAQIVRPSAGDINVRFDEVADYLNAQGLRTRYGVEGTPELLALFVSNGVPVIIESWIEYQGGIGHFRVVRGFDADTQRLIVHDPLGGADLRFSYEVLDAGWQAFNRHYLAVYRSEREPIVAAILGEDYDEQAMRRRALDAALARVEDQPGNGYDWLNLGDDYAALGQYAEARQAYEQAMDLALPNRLLWYHYEPLEVYNAIGEYQRTIELTTAIIRRTNGLEEMYYLRGMAYQGLGELERAGADYQAALARNPNYVAAQEALSALSE